MKEAGPCSQPGLEMKEEHCASTIPIAVTSDNTRVYITGFHAAVA
jgi:hypothetical protein